MGSDLVGIPVQPLSLLSTLSVTVPNVRNTLFSLRLDYPCFFVFLSVLSSTYRNIA